MKPLKTILVCSLLSLFAYPQAIGNDCCHTITFDRETGEPIAAALEKYYPAFEQCSGDCPITGPGGWDRPRE